MGSSDNGNDRISSLPDSLLHHILSFVTTKEAAKTCILSTRWIYLWASVSTLDFDDMDYDENDNSKFHNFVDSVLLLRNNSDLDKLSVKCANVCPDKNHILKWIRYAIKCNIKVLDIKLPCRENDSTFPYSIFGCQSLEELTLNISVDCLRLPYPVYGFKRLDRLRRLELWRVSFCKGFFENVMPNCPVLEDMVLLCDCAAEEVNITSNSLRSLEIQNCYFGCGLRISIPSLRFLTVRGLCPQANARMILLENLSSLLHVDVPAIMEAQFLGGLVNAKTIIYNDYLAFKPKKETLVELAKLPTFNNLKHLEMKDMISGKAIWLFARLLQRSPNLKTYKCSGLGVAW